MFDLVTNHDCGIHEFFFLSWKHSTLMMNGIESENLFENKNICWGSLSKSFDKIELFFMN